MKNAATVNLFCVLSVLACPVLSSLLAADEAAGFKRLTGTPAEDTLGWNDAAKFTSIPFEESLEFCGEAVSGTGSVLTAVGAFWKFNQFVYDAVDQPRHYYVEIVSGSDAGNRFDITANSGNTLTVDLDGGSLAGIVSGDEIRVYSKWTLDLLFPDGGSLTSSTAGMVGTEILLPSGTPGSVDFTNVSTFRYRSDLTRWINVNDAATDVGNILIPRGALLVIKQSSAAPIQPIFTGFAAASGFPLYVTVSYGVPEITVEQPVSTDLTDGSDTVDFGSVTQGSSRLKTFTIRSSGTFPLLGLTASVTGNDALDFTPGVLGATALNPEEVTTFAVQFEPGATGARTTVLQIVSNDSNENPFDITLTGSSSSEVTLETWAASFELSGSSLEPTADDDGDGISLLEEYIFNLNPASNDRKILIPGSGDSGLPFVSLKADRLQIEYIRRIGHSGTTVTPQFSNTLVSEDFVDAVGSETVIPVDAMYERVVIGDTVTAANATRRFARLLIEAP